MSAILADQIDREGVEAWEAVRSARVVLLTNFVPPHARPVYAEFGRRVKELTVLVSTPMEATRAWAPCWDELDVRVQRTWTIRRRLRHPSGVVDTSFLHVPLDTPLALRRLRPDAVISHELGFRSLGALAYKLIAPRTPLLICVAGSRQTEAGRGRLNHWLRRQMLRRADAIGVNSDAAADYVRWLGFDASRIHKIPYSHVTEASAGASDSRPPRAAHRILYVGQWIQRKGLEPWCDALVRWADAHPDRAVEFTLAGGGPLEGELRSRRWPANLKVEWLGHRDYRQLARLYSEHGLFVLPTWYDEWALVVNEALAAGLPVLGSRYSCAVEELVVDGRNGWAFRPDHPDELLRALEAAMQTSAESLDVMRRAAIDSVAPFTPEHAADQMVNALAATMRAAHKRHRAGGPGR